MKTGKITELKNEGVEVADCRRQRNCKVFFRNSENDLSKRHCRGVCALATRVYIPIDQSIIFYRAIVIGGKKALAGNRQSKALGAEHA